MNEQINSRFEEEVYRGARQAAANGYRVGVIGTAIGLSSVIGWVLLLPLKTVEPYVFVVDKTTGQTERVVAVDGLELTNEEAIIQSNLWSYVINRESYDSYDNEFRYKNVVRMSSERALKDYQGIWAQDNPQHPNIIYGSGVRLHVAIRSVTIINENQNLAQVEVDFTRKQANTKDRKATGVATVRFEYTPSNNTSIEDVWNNPLGFKVLEYRMDTKT